MNSRVYRIDSVTGFSWHILYLQNQELLAVDDVWDRHGGTYNVHTHWQMTVGNFQLFFSSYNRQNIIYSMTAQQYDITNQQRVTFYVRLNVWITHWKPSCNWSSQMTILRQRGCRIWSFLTSLQPALVCMRIQRLFAQDLPSPCMHQGREMAPSD